MSIDYSERIPNNVELFGFLPIAILLGVFIWGKLLGFLGLILAIPLTCLGIAYYRRYILHKDPLPVTDVTAMPSI